MEKTLTRQDVADRVAAVVEGLSRDECKTCDCFQGYLTQLELDAAEDVSDITAPWKVGRDKMHGCLGCNPCPPGSAFSQYQKETRSG